MAANRWDQTAAIVATIEGLFDKSASIERANPYRQKVIKLTGEEFVEKLHSLKDRLPKWQPPD